MPAAVIREAVDERVADIEEKEFRQVRNAERKRLRDEIEFEMLPRAFTRSNRTYAYIAEQDGFLVVDASSPKKAEDLIFLLDECLPRLQFKPYMTDSRPATIMTRWLESETPAGIELQTECELRDPADEKGRRALQRTRLVGRRSAYSPQSGQTGQPARGGFRRSHFLNILFGLANKKSALRSGGRSRYARVG